MRRESGGMMAIISEEQRLNPIDNNQKRVVLHKSVMKGSGSTKNKK
jgi:hypothetical protein